MRALWSCFCVLLRLWWPSWMNNRQRSRKLALNSSAGSRKSLSNGDCMSPLKHERHAWDLFICSTYEIPGCCQIDKKMGLYLWKSLRNSGDYIFEAGIRQKPLLPFSFYSICYLNVTLSNICHCDLLFMIVSSDNVFQSSEHTVLLKLKKWSAIVHPLWMSSNITN